MCDISNEVENKSGVTTIPVIKAAGMVLAHDITEIRSDGFKDRAFKKGYIVKEKDINHFQRLGKERLFVLNINDNEMHEDEAAYALATALMGEGVTMGSEVKEGKINIIADRNGLLNINKKTLTHFNMLGDVMCATLHDNTVVKKGEVVAGTRAIPLVVKRNVVEKAVEITKECQGTIRVKEMKKPMTGIVITGNEIYYGRIKDAFAPVITRKIKEFGGEIAGIYYAPDDKEFIKAKLKLLIKAGADLLITTGGMSVDPDDVTRFAIRELGAADITYGSAVLPGAMFLVAYFQGIESIPILGIPACGMYHKITIFDLILPRVLAGERIGRKEIAELGHGGLCMNCNECRYPVCPFGKGN